MRNLFLEQGMKCFRGVGDGVTSLAWVDGWMLRRQGEPGEQRAISSPDIDEARVSVNHEDCATGEKDRATPGEGSGSCHHAVSVPDDHGVGSAGGREGEGSRSSCGCVSPNGCQSQPIGFSGTSGYERLLKEAQPEWAGPGSDGQRMAAAIGGEGDGAYGGEGSGGKDGNTCQLRVVRLERVVSEEVHRGDVDEFAWAGAMSTNTAL
jgi:hypothetical protein